MRTNRVRILAAGFIVIGMTLVSNGQTTQSTHDLAPNQPPALVNTCIIANDVKGLVAFYERVLGIKASWSGNSYAELPSTAGTLAIFSSAAQEQYIPNVTEPGKNRSVILEFKVTDVDREYARLQNLVKIWVKPPTTQPWGTRSFYFRDPDGNLVDFYSKVKRK